MFGRLKYTTMNSTIVFLGVFCVFLPTSWVVDGLSDYRLCADQQCQSIISFGTGKINYSAGEKGMVSFKINSNIRVKSKSAGKDMKLWGIEVNGREGYAPKDFILEKKIMVKESDLKHIVPVILSEDKKPSTPPSSPVAALQPSEKFAATKEELELTTTTPLEQPTNSDNVLPVTNSAVDADKEAKLVPTKIEIVDGTAIPLLDDVNTKTSKNLNVSGNEDTTSTANVVESEIDNKASVEAETKVPQETEEQHLLKENKEEQDERKNLESQTLKTIADVSRENSDQDIAAVEDGSESEEDEEKNNNGDKKNHINKVENEKELLKLEATISNSSYAEEPSETTTAGFDLPELQNEVKIVKQTESDKGASVNVEKVDPSHADAENKQNQEEKQQEDKQQQQQHDGGQQQQQQQQQQQKQKEYEKQQQPETANDVEKVNPTHADAEKKQTQEEKQQEDKQQQQQPQQQKEYEKQQQPETANDNVQTKKEVKRDTSDKTTTDDSIQNVISNFGKQIDKKHSENDVDQSIQQTTNNTSSASIDENVQETTEPTVTESGYLHHVDPREEAFDTTTLPTVILPRTQSPEPQVSDATETSIINASNLNSAPTIEQVVQQVPNESTATLEVHNATAALNEDREVLSNNSTANISTQEQSEPITANITSEEKVVDKYPTNGEDNVPTLPLFQTTLQPELHTQPHLQQHTQHQHHHTDEQSQHIETITEATPEVNKTEETEVKTEAAPLPYADSNEQHEQAKEDVFVQPPQAPALSDEANGHMSSENAQLEEFESSTTLPSIAEDIQNNNNDVGVGIVENISPPVEETITTTTAHDNALDIEAKEKEQGLFATILGTVNSFLSNGKKEEAGVVDASSEDDELQRILFPERSAASKKANSDDEYCEKLSPNDCPSRVIRELDNAAASSSSIAGCQIDLNNMSMDMLLTVAGNKMLEISELLACLATVAVTCLFFLFVYYCFCNSSREGELLAKLNALERSLLATHKENAILKEDLMGTRNKLSSIEDNSFGSNDMVMALKKELEEELLQKRQLQEQVGNLEKELENAAEAGLELNKIVSELLSNQTGDESIISSVEELQKQLNEQQKTILEINANLAEKSRENSELQLMIAEQNARLSGEIASLQQDNDELEAEKSNLQTRLEEVKREFEKDITKALEGKNYEIKRLQSELVELGTKLEAEHTKYQTSLAKVEALEECLRTVRRDPSVNINQVIDVANVRAELLDMQKRYAALKERLDTETDAKKLFEEQFQLSSSENEKLKHDFHQSEKDKLEAQTRLEVLSNYFKEKETQLQKELSLKEAMWLKQQGETTSTVDRLTTMQDEIQALKSQNDTLRAEIEAQSAAHKAQTGTLENRAHETWMAARQSERRYEEARAEATALRRKLTSMAGVGGVATVETNFEKMNAAELKSAPSPIHMESPGSPLLGRLPPPPFLPLPFMGPPPPFMGMPPPFVPPGEMRPPPLGRLMSPPPGAGSGGSGGSGHLPPTRDVHRYSRNRSDFDYYVDEDDYVDDDDEDDDEEDEDEEEKRLRQRYRRRGSDLNGSWHRDDSYSPPPRAYRSQSPTDSRYNYNTERDLISTYDTETDFEPSPRKLSRHDVRDVRGSRQDSYRDYSPPPRASSPLIPLSNTSKRQPSGSAFSKGHMSSGSEKSYNVPPQRHGGKKSGKSAN